ncbi:serine/threonine-protein phosphatase [Glaciecola sp. XM2]|jgi:protein phosphatase|uniref:PP2C family protein-serine/threonine phosphatase n=1 Tax=Glaciecola sp. XM2 TaxID=1914931 RepID=UPI001BDF4CC6|nr:protein phosphatase 2C domain-containing protein [Glaciecola sp. XM2]MBT1451876.1 serine/threonine-protein phosphatase [Glaciecola sp. XM2]
MPNHNSYIGAGITHRGTTRPINQDAIFIDDKSGIWIVADGMGGHRAGEVASNWVCKHLPHEVKIHHCAGKEAIQAVHQKLRSYAQQEIEYEGMGTTMIMAVKQGDTINLYWSGDCRAYLLTSNNCKLLSKDHSVVQRLLDLNVIDQDEAARHPQRNIVTSCIGGDLAKPEIDEKELTLGALETLLLCSDGLYKALSLDEIHTVIKGANSLEQGAQNLVSQANAHGAKDNVSAILISPETQVTHSLQTQ